MHAHLRISAKGHGATGPERGRPRAVRPVASYPRITPPSSPGRCPLTARIRRAIPGRCSPAARRSTDQRPLPPCADKGDAFRDDGTVAPRARRRSAAVAARPGEPGGAAPRPPLARGPPCRRSNRHRGPPGGDGGPADRDDPRCPGPRGLVGQAGTGLRPEVHRHDLVAHLPGSDGRRRVRSADPTGLCLPPGSRGRRERRLRRLGPRHGVPDARGRRALPQRQSPTGADRLRLARRPARRRRRRLGGPGGDGRRPAELPRRRHVGARLPLRGERGPALRLGCDEGAPRPCTDPGRAAGRAGASGHRGRGPVPSFGRPDHGRLSGRLGRHDLAGLVPARVPVRVRRRRRPGGRSPDRGWAGGRPAARAGRAVAARAPPSRRPVAQRVPVPDEYPYRGRTWIEVDEPRAASKWVTLRACRVLRALAH